MKQKIAVKLSPYVTERTAGELADSILALFCGEKVYQLQRPDGSWWDNTKTQSEYNAKHANVTRTLYTAPVAAFDDGVAKRLRRVCNLVGIEAYIPDTNEALHGAMFAVLGQVSRAIEAAPPVVASEPVYLAWNGKAWAEVHEWEYNTVQSDEDKRIVFDALQPLPADDRDARIAELDAICKVLEAHDYQVSELCTESTIVNMICDGIEERAAQTEKYKAELFEIEKERDALQSRLDAAEKDATRVLITALGTTRTLYEKAYADGQSDSKAGNCCCYLPGVAVSKMHAAFAAVAEERESIAKWYEEEGWKLDEDDLPAAIRERGK